MPFNRLFSPPSNNDRKHLIGDRIYAAIRSDDELSLQKSLAELDELLEKDEKTVIEHVIESNLFHQIIYIPQKRHRQHNPNLADNIITALFNRLFFRLNTIQRSRVLQYCNKEGFNILQQAIAANAVKVINKILETIQNDAELVKNVLLNKNKGGYMALATAMKSPNLEIVEPLLQILETSPEALHANLCNRTDGGFMPFDSALKSRNPEFVKAFLRVLKKDQEALHANLCNRTDGGFTPLNSAVKSNNPEIVKMLLSVLEKDQEALHANLCHRTQGDFMPLDSAVKLGNPEILKALLKAFEKDQEAFLENLYNRAQSDFTLLNTALLSKNVEMVKAVLIALKKVPQVLHTNLHHRNPGGFMPLDSALNYGNLEIVRALLEVLENDQEALHKNLCNRTPGGFMPLDSAIKLGNPEIVKSLLGAFEKDQKALLENLYNRAQSDFTLLNSALLSKNVEVVNAVLITLEKVPSMPHANLCHRTQDGFMPLNRAVKSGNPEIVKALLRVLKKYPNALYNNLCNPTQGGFMPLDSALNYGNLEIVRALLEVLENDQEALHKNLCNRTPGGFMPLDSAIKLGNPEIVKALLGVFEKDQKALLENLYNRAQSDFTLLNTALLSKNIAVVKTVLITLEKFPDVLHDNLRYRTLGGFMPLDSALKSDNLEIVKALLEVLEKYPDALCVNLCNRTNDGWRVLQSLLKNSKVDEVRFILQFLLTRPHALTLNLHNTNNRQFSCLDTVVKSQNIPLLNDYLAAFRFAYKDEQQAQKAFHKLYASRQKLKQYDIPEIKQLIKKTRDGNFPTSAFLSFMPIEPFAGINAKYLIETPPPSAHKGNLAVKTKTTQYRLTGLSSNEESFAKYAMMIETPCLSAEYYSKQELMTKQDKITFICAGREMNALFPLPQQGRSVLVYTQEEFEKLSLLQVNFDKTDILVLKKIITAYGESASLKLLTSRRLGIFLMADYCHLNDFMMIDDNIQQVHFNSQQPVDANVWDDFYETLQQQLHDEPCVSVTRHVAQPPKKGQLGSKLFMINLQKIREQFSTPEALTLLFPNPQQAHKWGEDYYFQLMLHYAFNSQMQGYKVISKEVATLVRSMKHRNAFALGQGKRILAEHFALPDMSVLTLEQQIWVRNSIKRLNEIIDSNRSRLALMNASRSLSSSPSLPSLELQPLSELPAASLPLSPLLSPSQLISETNIDKSLDLDDEKDAMYFPSAFIDNLRYNIRFLNDEGSNPYLRPYQVAGLQRLFDKEVPSKASLIMAAGSGKTRMQCALACLAYEHVHAGEHIVIVTENINLVTQFYENLLNSHFPYIQYHTNEQLPSKDNIIPVSCKHTTVETLLKKHYYTGKPKVFIFCVDSLMNALELNPRIIKEIKLLMLDEYQTYVKDIQQILDRTNDIEDQLVLGFTATPPNPNPLPMIYWYSLTQAINQKVVAPMVADCAPNKFSANYIRQCIQKRLHPCFASKSTLETTKGIVYLSNQEQCDELHQYLQAAGINSFAIHGNNPRYEQDLLAFKQSTAGVILACRMCIIGFDDQDIGYVMITTNPSDINLEQMICRTNRRNGSKVGYVLTFNEDVHKRIQALLVDQKQDFVVNAQFLQQFFKDWIYHFAKSKQKPTLKRKRHSSGMPNDLYFNRKAYENADEVIIQSPRTYLPSKMSQAKREDWLYDISFRRNANQKDDIPKRGKLHTLDSPRAQATMTFGKLLGNVG